MSKHATRIANVEALTPSSMLLDPHGRLRRDWVELAGPEAPTLQLLLDAGRLSPDAPARFVGIDRDRDTLDGCRSLHGPDAPARWVHGNLVSIIAADPNAFPNAGILVFDSWNGARGREIEETLDILFRFARRREHDHGEFLLVLNVSRRAGANGRRTERTMIEHERHYKGLVSRHFGEEIPDDAWTVYPGAGGRRSPGMLLIRLRFGF